MSVKAIPVGFHTVTPYLLVTEASRFIQFLKDAFGAEELFRHAIDPDKIMHAQVKIGNSILMVSDAKPEWPIKPIMLYLYVENCDELYQRAVKAGGKSILAPTNQFYGDRSGAIEDFYGNQWWIATHIEDVPAEEFNKRAMAYRKE